MDPVADAVGMVEGDRGTCEGQTRDPVWRADDVAGVEHPVHRPVDGAETRHDQRQPVEFLKAQRHQLGGVFRNAVERGRGGAILLEEGSVGCAVIPIDGCRADEQQPFASGQAVGEVEHRQRAAEIDLDRLFRIGALRVVFPPIIPRPGVRRDGGAVHDAVDAVAPGIRMPGPVEDVVTQPSDAVIQPGEEIARRLVRRVAVEDRHGLVRMRLQPVPHEVAHDEAVAAGHEQGHRHAPITRIRRGRARSRARPGASAAIPWSG
jgi:hypothetical protein